MTAKPPPNIPTRLALDCYQWGMDIERAAVQLRVALPGIIMSFDPNTQTVQVQCAIRETIKLDGIPTNVEIPLLGEVPIIFPNGGGFVITFPVQPGDECLVIFADLCIDAWWQSGGIQNRMEGRRHDFSDAFAIVGPFSQRRSLGGPLSWKLGEGYVKGDICSSGGDIYICIQDISMSMSIPNEDEAHFTKMVPVSENNLQIRNKQGTIMIELTDNCINMIGPVYTDSVTTEGGNPEPQGATGAFTSQTGQLITVKDGLIVGIEV